MQSRARYVCLVYLALVSRTSSSQPKEDLNMFKKYVFGGKVVIASKGGWASYPLVIPKSYPTKQEKLYEEFWNV